MQKLFLEVLNKAEKNMRTRTVSNINMISVMIYITKICLKITLHSKELSISWYKPANLGLANKKTMSY